MIVCRRMLQLRKQFVRKRKTKAYPSFSRFIKRYADQNNAIIEKRGPMSVLLCGLNTGIKDSRLRQIGCI